MAFRTGHLKWHIRVVYRKGKDGIWKGKVHADPKVRSIPQHLLFDQPPATCPLPHYAHVSRILDAIEAFGFLARSDYTKSSRNRYLKYIEVKHCPQEDPPHILAIRQKKVEEKYWEDFLNNPPDPANSNQLSLNF